MNRTSFSFNLPEELIAQHPVAQRGTSRLLVLNRATGKIIHTQVAQLKKHVPDNTLLIFNNSRVRRARVFATSNTGGRVELIFLRPLLDQKIESLGSYWEVLTSKSKRQTPGKHLTLPDNSTAVVHALAQEGTTRILHCEKKLDENWFNQFGHIPLPPYIKREDEVDDFDRYQTLYSQEVGSVAAPTAGLHFTKEILDSLKDEKRKIDTAEVTLHVGLGTFLPVRVDNILDHKMHTEHFFISPETAHKVNQAINERKNILAVGTTSVRTLESAAEKKQIKPGYGETNIFIYPGYDFQIVNRLFTNFHTPESTLLMLVSAFAGQEKILSTYQEAIDQQYRFFSYGDCMLIL